MSDPTQNFAEKAHDLESLRKSLEDAASVGTGLWLSYLFALYSIAFAAAGVTHRDLLLDSPVKLPFLSVELPLVFFFVVAPGVFVVSHAYMLVHFVLLAGKAGAYDAELGKLSKSAQEELRRQLPSNLFLQFLAGPEEVREGGFGLILKIIVWMSVVVGPVVLLLFMQVQFLPYHHEVITWLHRIIVLLDLLLLWLLWPAVLERRSKIRFPRLWRHKIAALASLVPIGLAVMITTFPGEMMYMMVDPESRISAAFRPFGIPALHNLMFEGDIKEPFRVRASAFSSTIVLSDALEKETKGSDGVGQTLVLRGRHLEGAILNGSFLRRVDLTGARLGNASLKKARLHGAILDCAYLEKAWLEEAELQGAKLDGARLQGAVLQGAKFENTSFKDANTEGAVWGDLGPPEAPSREIPNQARAEKCP